MIESIEFKNFKALYDTTLPLGRFTLIVGPNGSGKTSALQSLPICIQPPNGDSIVSANLRGKGQSVIIRINLPGDSQFRQQEFKWPAQGGMQPSYVERRSRRCHDGHIPNVINALLNEVRIYSLDPSAIGQPSQLEPNVVLQPDGSQLPTVLDRLRDEYPERFEALNKELSHCLPEFDRILFETTSAGQRAFLLRTKEGHHPIKADDLSQGTLLALAILTLAHLEKPPRIVCFEEPDRGIHPRLLVDVRDALYRLSYPENYGEEREPVQVIATTHSPYFLDLFRDHPEEIVIAHKIGAEAKFERLMDRPDVEEILQDAHLGDVWYSGILGGVPSEP